MNPSHFSAAEIEAAARSERGLAEALERQLAVVTAERDRLRAQAARTAHAVNGYVVCNGYTGDGAVHVFVVAPDADAARELAAARFKEEATTGRGPRYPEAYWTRLEVEQVTNGVGASEVFS